MNPLISLVIPVYNVEKYLDKCMESVLAQTYDNFEVILVDDGSTDNSGKMCDEYAKKDSRVIVYHKPNGGLSDARNFGVEHCNADLVSFIDSDDYVTEDYLEYLWYLMSKYNCKMSCAGNKIVPEGKDYTLKSDNITEEKLDTVKSLERICYTSVGAWARLYKKELLLNNPFPVGRIYEDLASTYRKIAECDYVVFSDKQVYIWIQRENSITHSGISEKQMDIFWAADELYNFISKNYPEIKNAADTRCLRATIDFLYKVFSSCEQNEKHRFFKVARDFVYPHLKSVIKNKQVSFSIKAATLAIWVGYVPSKVLWALKSHKK